MASTPVRIEVHKPEHYRYGSFSFANEEEDPYFTTHAKPEGLDIVKTRADEFIRFQGARGNPVVLVTSGGSTVPLEVPSQIGSQLMRIKRYGLLIISVLAREGRVQLSTLSKLAMR
jgi:hypothetical protein